MQEEEETGDRWRRREGGLEVADVDMGVVG